MRLGTRGASGGPKFAGDVDNYKRNLNIVMADINKRLEDIKGATVKGMINAAIFIRNKTETEAPSTPVDLGNLRSSWFIVTADKKVANDKWNKGFRNAKKERGKYNSAKLSNLASTMATAHTVAISNARKEIQGMNTKDKKFLTMGYSANYAGYVHEYIGGQVVWKRDSPQSGPKWFEGAVKRNSQKILQIIGETSKLKK